MISLFTWNDTFLTRIPLVDQQHQQLVGLINDLGEIVMSTDEFEPKSFTAVRDGVFDYVSVHFATEESVMYEAGLDPQYIHSHQAIHQAFVTEALALGETGDGAYIEKARNLAEYLVRWLAYHILGEDQSMARQIHAVIGGQSPAEALELEAKSANSSTQPLLAAMSGLFFMVSERNRELRLINRELEQRVRQRTIALEQANLHLSTLSTQDDLTRLPNRRFAIQSLNQLWLEKERYGDTLSVLMLDADHFKEVNDRFGHAQGDALLLDLADRLRQAVRSSDIVCRIGGDEFLIICPRSTRAGAMEVAMKILAESKAFLTPDGVECWNGALSIGIAENNATMAQAEDLLKAADQAMYAAKRKGGACIS